MSGSGRSAAELFDLTGKVAVVTGGSRGLGREMVLAFAEAGADVVIASRKLDACEAVAAEVRSSFGRDALAFGCHVGHWDELPGLVDATYERFGKVDVLVNNAGMSPLYNRLIDVDEKLFDSVLNLNLKGPFRLSALIGTRMHEGDGGSIINISTTGSIRPDGSIIPYAASKSGVNAMTEGFAQAWGPKVRVNCIMPGPFLTDISKAWDMDTFQKGANLFYAMKRGGQPSEIVGAALYLASDASSFTTGAILRVDGGRTLTGSSPLFDLVPVSDGRWRVVVGEPILTGADAAHGVLLATAAAALEATIGRPVVWITGQFLRHAGPSATLDIAVDVLVDGRQTTQAAATVRVGDTEVVRAMATLGSRPFPIGDAVWATPPPDVPAPDPASPHRLGPGPAGRIIDRHRLHVAVGRWVTELDGTPGPGRAALWSRVVDGPRMLTPADVIIVSDFPIVPMSDALGVAVFGNSVDGTVRFVRRDVAAEWVLHDVTTEAVADGFVHTTTRLWADGTTLLAVASQTMILRELGPDGLPVRRGARHIAG